MNGRAAEVHGRYMMVKGEMEWGGGDLEMDIRKRNEWQVS